MIKIIKRGTRQQATCDRCGCIFSYEEEDINHLENHNGEYHFVDGTKPGNKKYVICPQCHHEFVINQTRCILAESEAQDADKCTYEETGCGSCKMQLNCQKQSQESEDT